MKQLVCLAICFLMCGARAVHADEMEELLVRLDSVFDRRESYVAEKMEKIEALHHRHATFALKLEDRMWLNKMLYDEFAVFNADSAMVYVDDNISIARRLGRADREQEWLLHKVFLFTAQGLLSEAEKCLAQVDTALIAPEGMFQYFDTRIYLASHLAQFIDRKEQNDAYFKQEKRLKQQARSYLTPEHPSYYSLLASLHRDVPRTAEGDSVKAALKDIVDKSPLTSRTDAINAHSLATMYDHEGDVDNYKKYLIYSAIADIKTANRDIASLEELSLVLYNYHDIDRGYAYISYCMKCALQYPNRVRMMNISNVMDKLQKAYRERNERQERELRTSLRWVSILLTVLLVSFLFICWQFRRLSRSRRKLDESNSLLAHHVDELNETQQMLARVNDELSRTNEMLTESNNRLLESNYVKEEYIGYVFSICSSYITKLEEYRKRVGRKIKAGQIDELKAMTAGASVVQAELKEFYHSFDAIFLHVYPDFVDDFNGLLREEERIVPKEGELLNTELRIYALVRLGINDSVKIAEFLHCSPQTVYNNRLRTRNKAIIPKEEFAERVHSLGKIQK